MAPTGNGKTILLAEDEQHVRSFVLAMLQMNGYSVMVAVVDGQDALKQSRGFEGTIHLLLSDVEMPNMTGIELAHNFRLTGRHAGSVDVRDGSGNVAAE